MKKTLSRYTATALLAFTLFNSCSKGELPEGILPQNKIVDVLVDVHLAQGIYGQRYSVKLNYKNLADDMYQSVLSKHELSDSTLVESIIYYSKDTEKYYEMYGQVVDRLNKMEVEITKEQEEEKKKEQKLREEKIKEKVKKDSLRMADTTKVKALQEPPRIENKK